MLDLAHQPLTLYCPILPALETEGDERMEDIDTCVNIMTTVHSMDGIDRAGNVG